MAGVLDQPHMIGEALLLGCDYSVLLYLSSWLISQTFSFSTQMCNRGLANMGNLQLNLF